MLSKLKFLAALGLAVLSVTANAQGSAWMVNAQDKSLSDLVERWAQVEGRHAKWEARGDFPIVNAERLNAAAKFQMATSMADAVERLLASMKNVSSVQGAGLDPKDMGYFACSFATGDVAVVIRSHGQPDCAK